MNLQQEVEELKRRMDERDAHWRKVGDALDTAAAIGFVILGVAGLIAGIVMTFAK